jgi:hypothetical protein
MGNVGGMPEFPAEDVKRIANEVMSVFVPVYVKQFGVALIQKLEMDAEGEDESEMQLKEQPVPSEPLKEGWFEKRGAVRKGWKRRYFVALNAADNYKILYFKSDADKNDPKKAAGVIEPCNLKVERLTKEEDIKEHGEFAIKFKPHGRRRTWCLRFKDEEELNQWEPVLKMAGRKAGAPLNEDFVLRTAFLAAYEQTRWRLGVWGWWRCDRNEQEMLGQMIVDRVEWDIMGDVYAKIPSGRMYWTLRHKMEDILDATVGAVVGAGWKGVSQTIESSKPVLEEKAAASLGPIIAKKVELKGTVQGKISGTLAPMLAEVAKPVLTPVLDVLSKPVYNAYVELLKIFHKHMSEIIANGCKPHDIKHFYGETRWYWGVMHPCYDKIREGTRSLAMEALDCVLTEVSRWDIEDTLEDRMRTFCVRAIYTWETLVFGEGEAKSAEPTSDPTTAMREVLRMMAHDGQLATDEDMGGIFCDIIKPPLGKMADPAIKTVIEPIESALPDVMASFLDLSGMVGDIIEGVIEDCVGEAVSASLKPSMGKLNEVVASLG